MEKIILTENSPKEEYEKVFTLSVGDVFKIASGCGEYETIVNRLYSYAPNHLIFRINPINPGTTLFTMYGPDHMIVIDKYIYKRPID